VGTNWNQFVAGDTRQDTEQDVRRPREELLPAGSYDLRRHAVCAGMRSRSPTQLRADARGALEEPKSGWADLIPANRDRTLPGKGPCEREEVCRVKCEHECFPRRLW
jgi:hypothetical protein